MSKIFHFYCREKSLYVAWTCFRNEFPPIKYITIPYSLYLAHSALRFFKIALEKLGKIASQLAHSEKESCLLRRAMIMTMFAFLDYVRCYSRHSQSIGKPKQ